MVRIERFGWTFCPGDKVQVENDYDRSVRSDLGIVARVDMEGELAVDFEVREAVYGFGELDTGIAMRRRSTRAKARNTPPW